MKVKGGARKMFWLLLLICLAAYFWDTDSPQMKPEKFYRNVRVVGVNPIEIGFPSTVIKTTFNDRLEFYMSRQGSTEHIFLVVFKQRSSPEDKVILPRGYLSFLKNGVPLTEFKILAAVGNIPRSDLQKISTEAKKARPNRLKIELLAKNEKLAKVLEMHYLGIPLELELRPEIGTARFRNSGLAIRIIANIQKARLRS